MKEKRINVFCILMKTRLSGASTFAMSRSTNDQVLWEQNIYDYNWGIQMSRLLLKIFGLWRNKNDTKMNSILLNIQFIIIVTFITLTVVLPVLIGMIITWGDLVIFIEIGLAIFAFSLAVMKLLFMYFNKEGIRVIFEMICEDWLDDLKDDEKSILIKSSKISRKMSIIGSILPLTSVAAYHGPVLLELGFLMRTGTNLTDTPGRPTSFISYFPFDMRPMKVYKSVIYCQCIGASIAVIGFTLTDLVFANVVFHASSMMEILSLKIRYMFDDDSQGFGDKIRMVVGRHCRIIEFIEKIGHVFNILMLGIFVSFALNFCLHGFCIINYASSEESNTLKNLFTTVFSICHFTDLTFNVYLISWAGQELIDQSEQVYHEIYNCTWFNLHPKNSIMWIMFLMRFKYSLVIYAGHFIPIDYPTFTKLMKTCGGYISVLVAMKE